MASPPNLKPQDAFDAAQQFINPGPWQGSSFQAQNPPSSNAFVSSGGFQNNRPGVMARNLIKWLIPSGDIVTHYINPQNISIDYSKGISQSRTKSGFVLQYWGPELTKIRISGHCGSSGIEGLNRLYNVYNAEQILIDPLALTLESQNAAQDLSSGGTIGSSLGGLIGGGDSNSTGSIIGGTIGSLLTGGGDVLPTQPKPTLAEYCFQIEMYYSGKVYRGFFTNFSTTESADQIGIHSYEMDFVATTERGIRQNYFAWHRSPDSASNSDSNFGAPYSFGTLLEGTIQPPQVQSPQDILTNIADNVKNSFGI